jgi:hypothetical protein
MGVLNPPPGGVLTSASTRESGAEVRYSTATGEIYIFSFDSRDMGYRLSRVERSGGRGVSESVNLDYAPSGDVSRASYRNWAEFRNLVLDVETQRSTPSFPAEIWRP